MGNDGRGELVVKDLKRDKKLYRIVLPGSRNGLVEPAVRSVD